MDLTPQAREQLRFHLEQSGAAATSAVRLLWDDGGLRLTQDVAREGDCVFTHEGRRVLLVDAELADELRDRTLQVAPTHQGPTFTFRETDNQ